MGTYTIGSTSNAVNETVLPNENVSVSYEIVSFKGAYEGEGLGINWLGVEFFNHSQVSLSPFP